MFLNSGTCFGFREVFLDSGKCFWIRFLEAFLNSGTCFWILGSVLEVFWIQGSVFGFWEVFWILGRVLSLQATVPSNIPMQLK